MTWPVVLTQGALSLRPLRRRDATLWRTLRAENYEWLAPWEATSPDPKERGLSFRQLIRVTHRQARSGQSIPLAVTWNGQLAGQLTVSGITGGSLRSAFLGYWISQDRAGQGIIPTAVALACDYCFFERGLHRMEINVRPENLASLRVVTKLGFREEGLRLRYLHIDGQWRDHRSFALTADELPSGGLTSRAIRASARDS